MKLFVRLGQIARLLYGLSFVFVRFDLSRSYQGNVTRELPRVNFPGRNFRGTWRNDGGRTRFLCASSFRKVTRNFGTSLSNLEDGEIFVPDMYRLRADQYSFLRFREDFEVSQVRSRIRRHYSSSSSPPSTSSLVLFYFILFFISEGSGKPTNRD